MDVSCSLTKNGEKLTEKNSLQELDFDDSLSIDFLLPGGANLNLNLPNNLMRAMCLLLDQLRVQASWGEAVLSVKKDEEIEPAVEEERKQNTSLH